MTAQRAIVAQAFTTYAEVVECALRLESEELDFKAQWKKKNGSTSGPIRTQPPNHNRGLHPTKPSNPPLKVTNPGGLLTPGPGEPQRGGQDITTVVCYNCQAMGHYKHDCPQPQRGRNGNFGNQEAQQPGQASFVKQIPRGPSQQQNGQNKEKQPMGTQQGI
ncbi:hypothetical protein RHMOL_Rhmol05G0149700 [Rhododendron molle]|uniref:Uncharacterized protein n=1 Tax=Rhododendron molle TaxID=49168 RepID=A0ACC0NP07_RHOML|nr:hypothetical protein RHMOL_Rhmol05G0149700 [Rhododendron molle]